MEIDELDPTSDEDDANSAGPPDAAQDVKLRADRKQREVVSLSGVGVASTPMPVYREGKGKERERTSLGGGTRQKRFVLSRFFR